MLGRCPEATGFIARIQYQMSKSRCITTWMQQKISKGPHIFVKRLNKLVHESNIRFGTWNTHSYTKIYRVSGHYDQ
jgi:hypothetical protein